MSDIWHQRGPYMYYFDANLSNWHIREKLHEIAGFGYTELNCQPVNIRESCVILRIN